MMTNTCQNVYCSNVGTKVKVVMIMEKTQKEEIHNIYLCRPCISRQNNLNGEFKN